LDRFPRPPASPPPPTSCRRCGARVGCFDRRVLDDAQTRALATLPFAEDLEIVARSALMPRTLLCTVAAGFSRGGPRGWSVDWEKLHTESARAEILKTMRMTRSSGRHDVARRRRRLFAAAGGPPPGGHSAGKTGR